LMTGPRINSLLVRCANAIAPRIDPQRCRQASTGVQGQPRCRNVWVVT